MSSGRLVLPVFLLNRGTLGAVSAYYTMYSKMKGAFILSYECVECGRDSRCDELLSLAIATVPLQRWRLTYSPEKALQAGTMFAELNLPFKGGRKR